MMSDQINADFSQFVVVQTNDMEWQQSPTPGIWRKRLELLGEVESGHVTSLVRFDPGAKFPDHPHPDGEEILVLDGVFSDETGDYPAGSYVLNPEGTTHAPWSENGCTLFVKLQQYSGKDRPHVVIDTNNAEWQPGRMEGMEFLPLYSDPEPAKGITRLTRVPAGCDLGPDPHPGGEEVFVIEGCVEDEFGRHESGTWFRHPVGSEHNPTSPEGCLLYVKREHLG
tara:strand:+ start:271 stop:945 length:675 start_codon:yes stop_codon:yes gene_type:complete